METQGKGRDDVQNRQGKWSSPCCRVYIYSRQVNSFPYTTLLRLQAYRTQSWPTVCIRGIDTRLEGRRLLELNAPRPRLSDAVIVQFSSACAPRAWPAWTILPAIDQPAGAP